MPRSEPRWLRFEEAIRDLVEQYGGKPGLVADKLREGNSPFTDNHIDGTGISAWRRGSARPRFEDFMFVGRRLFNDPFFVARTLGIIPDDESLLTEHNALFTRVRELEYQQRDLEKSIHKQADSGLQHVVATTCETKSWAVAVHPAVEGPPGVPMRVADRLDFKRIDGQTAHRQVLQSDLGQIFSAYNVLDSRHATPRWSGLAELDAAGERKDDGILRYSLSHTTAPFAPVRPSVHKHLPFVAVVSGTWAPWTVEVAAFLARVIGYGLTSTRALSRSGFGMSNPAEAAKYRTRVHRDLLQHPHPRYVWGHFDINDNPGDFFPGESTPPIEGMEIVWLRESDELVRESLRQRGFPAKIAEDRVEVWRQCRDNLDRQYQTLTDSGHRIHLIEQDSVSKPETPLDEYRQGRWEAALQAVVEIVRARLSDKGLSNPSLKPILEGLERSDHHIDKALYDWLELRGHFVQPRRSATVR